MPNTETMRKQIIHKLLEYAKKQLSPKKLNLMRPFIEQFYAYTSPEDLSARSIKNLFGALMSHWELMYQRQPGERKRHIFNPTLAADDWETSHTAIQYILDDQPFLVDTLTTEINRQGLTVHFMVHLGGIKLIRNAKNQITQVLPLESSDSDAITEAPIYIEIDKQTNPATLEKLGHNLDQVLDDAQKAVRDWKKMEAEIYNALGDLEKNSPQVPEEELEESKAFLQWLLANHFTFLGFRAYSKVGAGEKMGLKIIPHSSLGVLSNTTHSRMIRYYSELPPAARKLAESNQIIELAKTNTLSTVHGRRYTDFVSVKNFNKAGAIIGERWFVGLYTSSVYVESPRTIPLIRLKVLAVLRRSGLPENGHAYKALIHILETLPRDDLFHANTDELFNLGMGILELQDRRCVRMFARKDIFGRFISCLVYVPHDEVNIELCYRLQDILLSSFHGLEISYTTTFFDAILARIHFTIRIDPKHPHTYDLKAIEKKLIEAGRSWKDLLHENLIQVFGEEKGNALTLIYMRAFPASYKENYSALEATSDIKHIEQLSKENILEMNLYRTENMPAHLIRLKLFHLEETIPLSDAIPILEKMGLRVIGEQPHQIQPKERKCIWINDFLVQRSSDAAFDLAQKKELFEQAFKKIWGKESEDDGFNSLVISANLNWREIAVLRAYAKYLKQIEFTFSQDYMEEALSRNPNVAYLLIQLFHCRFDPSGIPEQVGQIKRMVNLEEQIKQSLDEVDNLDQDRILRMFWNLIQASVRTNFFQIDAQGEPKPYLSFKFNPEKVRDLPLPRPEHEIFVYSAAFEGLHLRANKVARGGIRWSDRREDFRREVLGLMKAQQVKNAIIVPAGAKGGFVTKLAPLDCSRETLLKIGISCYQNFIRGLLDLTDNLIDHRVVRPENTLCHDDHDTYLVVAADKGTATFSDIANGISKEYNFWLGDAFASGGCTGYDHKKIGITARGAWESVKQHFQEIEKDINQPFTVVGIGDMAGDVFGNGMLQSSQIKLVAAFNGAHIFLDPNPDPASSFAERERLFNLPRSTWQDYNPKLISKGGGIFSRALKTIKISAEIKSLFDCKKDQLTPNELIQTILKAPVDLLWNGGIGTFVKSSKETNRDAGDRSNDAIRVNANELTCLVVGEGGNLGFTQLARIEYELNGGRINTDFIDNSGGVDCSDHEVNIKILLDQIVDKGQLTEKNRNRLLAQMTDEVAQLVLHNNYRQVRAISIATSQSSNYITLYAQFLKDYSKQGKIDRSLEFLPDEDTLMARKAAGKGLTRPEIAVLQAYSKIILKAELVHSNLPLDPHVVKYIQLAFPKLLQRRYFAEMEHHRLRHEIIATQLSNLLVTDMGVTFAYQMYDETRASPVEITQAYIISREIFNLQKYWDELDTLTISATEFIEITLEVVRLIRRSVRWFLRNTQANSIEATVERFTAGIQNIQAKLPELLTEAEKSAIEQKTNELAAMGIPTKIAYRLATIRVMSAALNIIEVATTQKQSLHKVATTYFGLIDQLGLDEFRELIDNYPTETHSMVLARSASKGDLDWIQRALTTSILKMDSKISNPQQRLDLWLEKNKVLIDRWQTVLTEMKASLTFEYSMLVVAIRELLDLNKASLV